MDATKLTPKEAELAIVFLNRNDLKGTESITHGSLLMKLMAIRDGRELEPVKLDTAQNEK